MTHERPFAPVIGMLNRVGIRPTRQRLALARLLFDGADRHVTADQLHGEAVARGVRVSVATVYNTLHQFTAAGILREVVVTPGRSYFDTNTAEHHHFFFEDTGEIRDSQGVRNVDVFGSDDRAMPRSETGIFTDSTCRWEDRICTFHLACCGIWRRNVIHRPFKEIIAHRHLGQHAQERCVQRGHDRDQIREILSNRVTLTGASIISLPLFLGP